MCIHTHTQLSFHEEGSPSMPGSPGRPGSPLGPVKPGEPNRPGCPLSPRGPGKPGEKRRLSLTDLKFTPLGQHQILQRHETAAKVDLDFPLYAVDMDFLLSTVDMNFPLSKSEGSHVQDVQAVNMVHHVKGTACRR